MIIIVIAIIVAVLLAKGAPEGRQLRTFLMVLGVLLLAIAAFSIIGLVFLGSQISDILERTKP